MITLNATLCPQSSCPLVFGDYIAYRDSGHLTMTFSLLLKEELDRALALP